MKKVILSAALAALVAAPVAAQADTTAYDATVNGGFMPGHGDPQNNFTVVTSTDGFVQLGLSAQPRFSGPAVPDNGAGTYFAFVGSNKSGSGLVGAIWNFDFSVETSGSLLLSGLQNVTITVENSEGTIGTINPFDSSEINDNTPVGSTTVAQNSENIDFSGIFNLPKPNFDVNLPDSYTITLSAQESSGATVSDVIHVDAAATPLPSAAGMGLLLVAGLGAVGLLRKRFTAA